jgi:large repetitive protein
MNKAISFIICFLFYSNLVSAKEIVKDTSVVFVKSIPNKLIIYADKSNIKKGEVVTLSTSECSGTVIWDNGSNEKNRVVSPNQSMVYNAYCSRSGCNGSAGYLTINVSDSPLYVEVSNSTICQGNNVILKANGCIGNYIWSDGQNGQTIVVLPSQTTVYGVDCYINGVLSGQSSGVVEVTRVPDIPEVQYSREILLGDSTLISAYCNSGVVWDTISVSSNNRFKANVWVKPTVATKYTVYCSNGNCVSDRVDFSIRVKTDGIVLTDGKGFKDSVTLCSGDSLRLNVIGCLSNKFNWMPNVSLSDHYNTISQISQLYVVECVDSIYGSHSDSIYVTVLARPELKFTIEKSSEFVGSTVKINTSGCDAKNIVWFRKGIISNSKVSYEYVSDNQLDTVYFSCQGFCKSDTQAVVIQLQLLKPNPEVLTKKICEGNLVTVDSGCPNNSEVGLWVNGTLFNSDSTLVSFPYIKTAKYQIACIDKVTKKFSEKVSFAVLGTGADFKNLIVFPNPFDDFFKISSDGCLEEITIRLYDVEGRLINKNLSYVNEDGLLKVFGDFLATGNYIIQIIKDNTVYATKVIIKQNLN